MKLRTILPALLLVFGVVFGGASHAHADYTLWTPTDINQNVFSFTSYTCTMPADLYINAPGAIQGAGNAGNALLLSNLTGQPYQGTDFWVIETGNTYGVYSTGTATPGSLILSLGSTNQFGLYYNDYNTGTWMPTITDVNGLYDQWLLTYTSQNCDPVLLVDATPSQEVGSETPIPPSVLLMASGLAGVFGFLRRFSG